MNKFLTCVLFVMGAFLLNAQEDFMDDALRISGEKDSYITLMDGTELVGKVKSLNRKKGLFTKVVLEFEDGKKRTLMPNEIDFMYLPPSGFSKFATTMEKSGDLNKMGRDSKASKAMMRPGYFYFESSEVIVKKKTMTLLLQMLNPATSSKIKVFNDPYSQKTMSVGIGGMTVAGGDDKSYYVKIGDEPAFRLYKKNYDEEWGHLYNNCRELLREFPDGLKWSKFSDHIAVYDASGCK